MPKKLFNRIFSKKLFSVIISMGFVLSRKILRLLSVTLYLYYMFLTYVNPDIIIFVLCSGFFVPGRYVRSLHFFRGAMSVYTLTHH